MVLIGRYIAKHAMERSLGPKVCVLFVYYLAAVELRVLLYYGYLNYITKNFAS